MIQTDTLKNGYKIIRDTERFQFGIDAVLLADFAADGLHEDEKVIARHEVLCTLEDAAASRDL